MAISPDGEDLLAVPQSSPGGFTAFARNTSSGALARRPEPRRLRHAGRQRRLQSRARAPVAPTLLRPARSLFTGNGLIYAGSSAGPHLVFKRDFYPVCRAAR